jgi:hypothetical protein
MRLKDIVKIVNGIGVTVAIMLFVIPQSYFNFVVFLNITLPLLAVGLIVIGNGEIGIDSKRYNDTPNPKIYTALFFPSFALVLYSLLNIKVIEIEKSLIYSVVFSFPIILLAVLGSKEFLRIKKIVTGLLFCFFFTLSFGYGTVTMVNSILDSSEVKKVKAKILDKVIDENNGTSYRIDYEPWYSAEANDGIRISKGEFMKYDINDSIELESREGYFNIEWIRRN